MTRVLSRRQITKGMADSLEVGSSRSPYPFRQESTAPETSFTLELRIVSKR
jgi:hypothetical protein